MPRKANAWPLGAGWMWRLGRGVWEGVDATFWVQGFVANELIFALLFVLLPCLLPRSPSFLCSSPLLVVLVPRLCCFYALSCSPFASTLVSLLRVLVPSRALGALARCFLLPLAPSGAFPCALLGDLNVCFDAQEEDCKGASYVAGLGVLS
jgi:hypothetical protein